jgi:hypothetical protein
MTHDELQQRVNDLYTNVNEENPTRAEESKAHYAIRAVVELHKPWTMENGDGEESLGCSCIPELPAFLNPYPCKTIQAIEKELQ